jgi:hypothetical protein
MGLLVRSVVKCVHIDIEIGIRSFVVVFYTLHTHTNQWRGVYMAGMDWEGSLCVGLG